MKLIIAVIALVLAISAKGSPAPYAHDVVAYANPWPVKTSTVWPAYGGLYGGGKVAVVPDVAYEKYAAYPNVYGSWPVYGKSWGYSAPPVVTKVVDNGLWNYGGYGYGNGYGLGYNKYW
ncbi:hypothetical protein RP20_CCG013570 [Aedes albopictus]|nr:hypothetical protein RP20_CCG013570 [Aedes albopictus]